MKKFSITVQYKNGKTETFKPKAIEFEKDRIAVEVGKAVKRPEQAWKVTVFTINTSEIKKIEVQ